MSEDEVHLKEIMQIPGVKALFEKHGYATSFVPNEFILTPPMFNNIYKGALGEVVGKYILPTLTNSANSGFNIRCSTIDKS